MDLTEVLPSPPSFPADEWERCKRSRDFLPIAFEWYRHVGELNVLIAFIQPDSPAFIPMPRRHYHVLMGLLTRCSRLILANMALSHEGKFGETTAIVDRCIFESALKVMWLCADPSAERFSRFIADGLRPELEFNALIERNIALRDGMRLNIENRMLASIDRHFRAGEVTPLTVAAAKKLPDLASMIESLNLGRMLYVAGQRLGSHHVHGTWSSLLLHYLEEDEHAADNFVPRAGHVSVHLNQFTFTPTMVIEALKAYLDLAFTQEDAGPLVALLRNAEAEIMRIAEAAAGDDMLVAEGPTDDVKA